MKASSLAACAALALGAGCDWRVFDDLQDDLWVDVQASPTGVGSSGFGAAIVGLADGEGLSLGVVGRTRPTYSLLHYSTTGRATSEFTENGPNEMLGVGADFDFDPQPVVAVSSDRRRTALAYITDVPEVTTRNIKLYEFETGDNGEPVGEGRYEPGAINETIIAQFAVEAVAFAGDDNFLIAALGGGDLNDGNLIPPTPRIYRVDQTAAANTELSACDLPPGEYPYAVAFGEFGDFGAEVIPGGDIIVLTAPVTTFGEPPTGPGTLRVLTSAFGQGTLPACEFADVPELTLPLGSGRRVQLLPTDLGDAATGTKLLVTSTGDNGAISIVSLDPTAGFVNVDTVPVPDLSQIAIGDIDGDGSPEIAAGQAYLDDGADIANAGQVSIFDAALAQIGDGLRVASPRINGNFGNAVAFAPFTADGVTSDVLVVGDGDQIYTYFRAPFYPGGDVRPGQ